MVNRSAQRFLFCAITHEAGHGGIARVSSLLWLIVQSKYPDSCNLVTVAPPGRDRLNWINKVNFFATAALPQIRGDCDAVFFDHLGLARVQRLIPHSKRRPYGVFLHSIEAWTPLTRNRLQILVDAKVRIANSHYTAARVAAAHPEVGEIDVCHLTLGPEMWGGRSRCGPPATNVNEVLLGKIREKSILIVGRMMKRERHKGHDQLIQSWPLVKQHVRDAQLVIVGRGDDVPRLQTLARQLGVERSVLFTGPVDDQTLHAIYEQVAAFAMPSKAEGFGIVYLEAMAHRLPCIGSIHDAAREIIVDEETGYLVDQDDVRDLASKLVRLLLDSSLRFRLGCRGMERLQTQFSFERFESRASELLNTLG
jgi:glycosyltransferase involved in cell wall biosynthesis